MTDREALRRPDAATGGIGNEQPGLPLTRLQGVTEGCFSVGPSIAPPGILGVGAWNNP